MSTSPLLRSVLAALVLTLAAGVAAAAPTPAAKMTYERLLEVFWHNTDPLTPNAQFCDHGRQYRTAIFFHDETQHRLAEKSKKRVEAELHATVVTEITAASTFYRAEEYHQDFYKKDPTQYHQYRQGCGRDRRLQQLWGPSAGH